jgi:hypothetical protein
MPLSPEQLVKEIDKDFESKVRYFCNRIDAALISANILNKNDKEKEYLVPVVMGFFIDNKEKFHLYGLRTIKEAEKLYNECGWICEYIPDDKINDNIVGIFILKQRI